jgi:hypothetical protein
MPAYILKSSTTTHAMIVYSVTQQSEKKEEKKGYTPTLEESLFTSITHILLACSFKTNLNYRLIQN